VTVHELRRELTARLARAGVASPEAEAAWLLTHLLGVSRAELGLLANKRLEEAEARVLEGWLARRERREPLQHILGFAPFYGLTLRVTPAVLIPRPETEQLVEIALQQLGALAAPRVLDVGTGCGAIALAIKHELPDALVMATDLSYAALEVAAANAAALGYAVALSQADLLAHPEVEAFAREADLVTANLPYLPESDWDNLSPEVQADPPLAIFAGRDGLEQFKRLLPQAHALLKPGAWLIAELDPRNAEAALTSATNWADRQLRPDLLDRPRFVLLQR